MVRPGRGSRTLRASLRRVLRRTSRRRGGQRARRAAPGAAGLGHRSFGRGDRACEHLRRHRTRGDVCGRSPRARRARPSHLHDRSRRGSCCNHRAHGCHHRRRSVWNAGRTLRAACDRRAPRSAPRRRRRSGPRCHARRSADRLDRHGFDVLVLPGQEPRRVRRRRCGDDRRSCTGRAPPDAPELRLGDEVPPRSSRFQQPARFDPSRDPRGEAPSPRPLERREGRDGSSLPRRTLRHRGPHLASHAPEPSQFLAPLRGPAPPSGHASTGTPRARCAHADPLPDPRSPHGCVRIARHRRGATPDHRGCSERGALSTHQPPPLPEDAQFVVDAVHAACEACR